MTENDTTMVTLWMGRDIRTLEKDELLEVIDHLSRELQGVRCDRDRWRNAGDVAAYLMNGRSE